jgi:large subunit ribosomal protein L10
MGNPRNEASVEALRQILTGTTTFFLVDYQGLSVGEFNSLRTRVREVGGRILVAKNTLINLVLKENGFDGFDEALKGPTALVLVDDPIEPAKVMAEFSKGHAKDLPVSKGALLEGEQLGAEAIERIAKLPSRPQLLSELLGVLNAPLQQLVGVLEGPQRNMVSVVTNYSEKLKEEDS